MVQLFLLSHFLDSSVYIDYFIFSDYLSILLNDIFFNATLLNHISILLSNDWIYITFNFVGGYYFMYGKECSEETIYGQNNQ